MNTRIVPGKIYICNYLNATNVMLYLGRCRVHYKSDICAYDMQGYFYYSLAILPDEELNRIAFEDCYFDEPLNLICQDDPLPLHELYSVQYPECIMRRHHFVWHIGSSFNGKFDIIRLDA